MKGLRNLGNTCYFNSALQCVLQIPPISNYAILNKYVGDCEFTREYFDLVRRMWIVKEPMTENPEKLMGIFRTRFPQFDNSDEHDCQEAFLHIIDLLEKEFPTLIKNSMYATMSHTTKCKSETSVISDNTCIHLLTPKRNGNTLADLIRSYHEWNVFSNYEDAKGVVHNAAASRTLFETLPRILVFSFAMYDSKKRVHIDMELTINGTKFVLFGTCVHRGIMNSGHYVAYTKHNDKWYLKDDEMATVVDTIPLHDYHYLVMYKHIK